MKVGMTVEINGNLHHIYTKSVAEMSALIRDLSSITKITVEDKK
jgi:hypothetical protein